MKIVGLISSEDELNEIEIIAKIFVLERRMKELLRKEQIVPILKPTKRFIPTKHLMNQQHINYQVLNVRGFH